jgi:ParB/RepB/Spo0J family partition protein
MSAVIQSSRLSLPLSTIVLSHTEAQTQRRKAFAEPELNELASSIKQHGLVNPILVRPTSKVGWQKSRSGDHWYAGSVNAVGELNIIGAPHSTEDEAIAAAEQLRKFELVAGERRLLAARIAGLEQIDATVRDLTDEQVLEVQLIENLQRSDLHPLHEAEGYEQLMKLHGHTADELGDKVGKSKRYVYARIQLLKLCKEARAAFYEGKLSATTALLVARIPDAGLQKKACKEITQGDFTGAPLSSRRALEYIEREYMLRLSDAPFDIKNQQLVAKAGACGACPRRTGNNPDLFGDIKGADVCTDPICYQQKVQAHGLLLMVQAKQNGQRVLIGAEAKKAITYENDNHVSFSMDYAQLGDVCYDDPKNRTYKQILGSSAKTIVVKTPKGRVVELVERKEASKQLKAAGIKKPTTRTEHKSKHEGEITRAKKYHARLFKAIFDKTEISLREAAERLAVTELENNGDTADICLALGWGDINLDALKREMSKLSLKDLAKLIAVLPFGWELGGYGKPDRMLAAAKSLKIDAVKIKQAVIDEEKTEKASKKKASKR